MRQQDGITLAEFARLCNRKRPGCSYVVSINSTATFLKRCEEVGLVTRKVGEDDLTRYSPTHLLRYLLPDEDD